MLSNILVLLMFEWYKLRIGANKFRFFVKQKLLFIIGILFQKTLKNLHFILQQLTHVCNCIHALLSTDEEYKLVADFKIQNSIALNFEQPKIFIIFKI